LKKLIHERKKKFWAEIGDTLGKTGAGCEKAAKAAKLSFY
jgi:hypothetical protein